MGTGQERRLQIGGTPISGWDYRSLEDLYSPAPVPAAYDQVRLGQCLEDLGDLWPVFRACRTLVTEGGRLSCSRATASQFSGGDIANLLRLNGFEPSDGRRLVGSIELDAVARDIEREELSCTVVIPCRNELGNIDGLVRRTPQMGRHTEILFVDGASTDGTPDRILQQIQAHPDRDMALLHQKDSGGKAEAVFLGFDQAQSDVVMILDADMTVAPEDLPRFFLAIAEGNTDFANGTRFLYQMEEGAMRITNNVGNRMFCSYLSWLLGARITDTLCGTKAMRRTSWRCIREARPLFGEHDPWGDFDLLLGAAYCGLHVADVPIVYGARTAGESKMHAFSHGAELAKTCLAGFAALKLRRHAVTERV